MQSGAMSLPVQCVCVGAALVRSVTILFGLHTVCVCVFGFSVNGVAQGLPIQYAAEIALRDVQWLSGQTFPETSPALGQLQGTTQDSVLPRNNNEESSGGWWNLFEGGLNVGIPKPCRGGLGASSPQDFFVIFTNKQSILMHSDKIKAKQNIYLQRRMGPGN
jgi:hypothetical protein